MRGAVGLVSMQWAVGYVLWWRGRRPWTMPNTRRKLRLALAAGARVAAPVEGEMVAFEPIHGGSSKSAGEGGGAPRRRCVGFSAAVHLSTVDSDYDRLTLWLLVWKMAWRSDLWSE